MRYICSPLVSVLVDLLVYIYICTYLQVTFFNLDKCHVMAYGRSQQHHSYTMMNADGVPFPLQRWYEEQDLGVLFTPNLKFSEHISKITHKANCVVGIIKRSFSCLDKAMFRTLYVTMVCPRLEYASQIWNPYLIRDIQALEKVQRRTTKFCLMYRMGGWEFAEITLCSCCQCGSAHVPILYIAHYTELPTHSLISAACSNINFV